MLPLKEISKYDKLQTSLKRTSHYEDLGYHYGVDKQPGFL